jgi:CubicO group peptidase (beta-lactamase class C family)
LAAYALFHLAVHKHDTPFLTRASGLKLHTAAPNNNNYAHGWVAVPGHEFAEGDALWHAGTSGYWQSAIWLDPESGAGLIGFCNLGGNSSEQAIFALFDELAAEYLAKSE